MSKLMTGLLAVLLILTLASCKHTSGPTATEVMTSPSPIPTSSPMPTPVQTEKAYANITVQTAKQLIDTEKDITILDVRTRPEFYLGHIDGAILIPVSELANKLGELDKGKKIIVYCKTGVRSATASEMLVENGFRNVYNMLGGIVAWHQASYPVATLIVPTPSPSATTAQTLLSKISVTEVKSKLDSGVSVVLVDVRPKVDFNNRHVSGAISIPLEELSNRYMEIPPGSEVVVYTECTWGGDTTGTRAVQTLLGLGIKNVIEMDGGFIAWIKAGYPVAPAQ